MNTVYKDILGAVANKKNLLAILIDPDKITIDQLPSLMQKVNSSIVTHVFVGGSTVNEGVMDKFTGLLKEQTSLPVVIFPGDITQISNEADALLFLSLISGRNPDYLITKHIEAVDRLQDMDLEVIPTGYILIENGKETTVQRVSRTAPMSRDNVSLISNTARAGELLGMKLIYLEAGSGAMHPINEEIIFAVRSTINVPLIVGGGIRNTNELAKAFNAGANLVVIGTAFEENQSLIQELTLP